MNAVFKSVKKAIPQSAKNYLRHYPAALASNVIYAWPSRQLKVIGVTGTDGKTTTVNMVYQILKAAGKNVSMVSTINAAIGDKTYQTGFHVTSPDPFLIQKLIRQAVSQGSEYVVLEVTSHALDQFRFLGIKFDIGVITNVTHEHLDYHKTFENYLYTKAKLIRASRWAVLNQDDPSFTKLKEQSGGQVVSFGLSKKADWNLAKLPLKLKIIGQYNQLNALAAAAVGSILGIDQRKILDVLNNFSGLPGRMEEIPNSRGLKIIVDFAHTPNALEQALETLRAQTPGQLIAVFGAASERDLAKRPAMGQIAARLADKVVLTDEDPRFEPSLKIIEEIATGAYLRHAKDGVNLFKEPDRAKAIAFAISLAKKGDTIGIFGKGHEGSMNYFGTERPWSDQSAVRKALKWTKK